MPKTRVAGFLTHSVFYIAFIVVSLTDGFTELLYLFRTVRDNVCLNFALNLTR